ncbi:MAG: hypothetical protein IJU77_13490 [Butyrivibrio sp.]|nr:hypothetical protein [Butyrivibrio sp.]
MKKILALAVASVVMVSSTVCAFATENTTGSFSPEAQKVIEDLQKQIKDNEKQINDNNKLINDLTYQLITSKSSGGGGGSSSSSSTPSAPSGSGNVVNYGGTVTYQGGKVEINGGKSNVTFTIKVPSSSVMSSANQLAGKLGGSLLSCISTSSPGASFSNAKVNFYVGGVTAGDNIAVYQNQNGSWVQLPVAEVRQDHVVVNMTKHGDLAFVRVPVMAYVG